MLQVKNKRNDNKQGVILVTVVFILAFAFIFITCALMLTNATRSRLYVRAEKSQARLTVTSVAEAFYQALYAGQITDEQMQAICNAKINTPLYVTATGIPGMGSVSDNCTTITFRKIDSNKNITVDFSTKIGTEQEDVRLILKYNEPPRPVTGMFSSTIETGGLLNAQEGNFGYNAPAGATDNTILVRGDYTYNAGGLGRQDENIIIIKGNILEFRDSSNTTLNNYVMWGTNNKVKLQGNSITVNTMAFVNPTDSATNWSYEDYRPGIHSFKNEVYYNGNQPSRGSVPIVTGGQGLTINNSFSIPNGGDASTCEAVAKALAMKDYIEGDFPTTAVAIDNGCFTQENISSYASYTNLNSVNKTSIAPGNYKLTSQPMGTYYFDCTGGAKYTIVVDFPSDRYLDMGEAKFVCTNATSPYQLVFVLLNGVQIEFDSNSHGGILSTPGRNGDANSTGHPSDAGTGKPSAAIFGVGNNSVVLRNNVTVDAYIGLYGPDVNSAGVVTLHNGSCYYYGRIMCKTTETSGASPNIPYCPSPASQSVPEDKLTMIFSNYSIQSFLYYYSGV